MDNNDCIFMIWVLIFLSLGFWKVFRCCLQRRSFCYVFTRKIGNWQACSTTCKHEFVWYIPSVTVASQCFWQRKAPICTIFCPLQEFPNQPVKIWFSTQFQIEFHSSMISKTWSEEKKCGVIFGNFHCQGVILHYLQNV